MQLDTFVSLNAIFSRYKVMTLLVVYIMEKWLATRQRIKTCHLTASYISRKLVHSSWNKKYERFLKPFSYAWWNFAVEPIYSYSNSTLKVAANLKKHHYFILTTFSMNKKINYLGIIPKK